MQRVPAGAARPPRDGMTSVGRRQHPALRCQAESAAIGSVTVPVVPPGADAGMTPLPAVSCPGTGFDLHPHPPPCPVHGTGNHAISCVIVSVQSANCGWVQGPDDQGSRIFSGLQHRQRHLGLPSTRSTREPGLWATWFQVPQEERIGKNRQYIDRPLIPQISCKAKFQACRVVHCRVISAPLRQDFPD